MANQLCALFDFGCFYHEVYEGLEVFWLHYLYALHGDYYSNNYAWLDYGFLGIASVINTAPGCRPASPVSPHSGKTLCSPAQTPQ